MKKAFTPLHPENPACRLLGRGVTGFTLYELIIVLVITGILVAIGVPSYIKMHEGAYDKEAIGNLRRLQEAEKLYRVENKTFYPVGANQNDSTISSINSNLKVNLPEKSMWNYTVWNVDNGHKGCVMAKRNGNNGRVFYLPIEKPEDCWGLPNP